MDFLYLGQCTNAQCKDVKGNQSGGSNEEVQVKKYRTVKGNKVTVGPPVEGNTDGARGTEGYVNTNRKANEDGDGGWDGNNDSNGALNITEGDLRSYIPTQRTYGNRIYKYNGCMQTMENTSMVELITMEYGNPVGTIFRLCHHVDMTCQGGIWDGDL